MFNKKLIALLLVLSMHQLQSMYEEDAQPDTSQDELIAATLQELNTLPQQSSSHTRRNRSDKGKEHSPDNDSEELVARRIQSQARSSLIDPALIIAQAAFEGTNLGKIITQNRMILLGDAGVQNEERLKREIKPNTLEHTQWISKFNLINFSQAGDQQIVDVSALEESTRLAQGIQNLSLPCVRCDGFKNMAWYQKLAWYKRYKSHLIIGASAFTAGILCTLGFNKLIK